MIRMRKNIIRGLLILLVIGLGVLWLGYRWWTGGSDSNAFIRRWLTNPNENPNWSTPELTQCPDAPFIIPTEGFIGLLWGDTALPYNPLRRHTGLDIFGNGESGTIPVYAVYDGYLSRLDDWFSTVIIRHDDPLQAGRQIWTYYTHMASRDGSTSYIVEDFPQGTFSTFVEQGTLIGYQGEYSPGLGVAMHLHISIVTSEPDGSFRNEALIENTLDPSPYFGMDVSLDGASQRPPRCRS